MTTYDPAQPRGALTGRLVLLAVVIAGASVLLSALFLPGAIAVDRTVGHVHDTIVRIPGLPPELNELAENSVIVAADGTKLAELHDRENRILVSLQDVPRVTQEAVIATEDAAFWSHNGVNHEAILRALFANLRSGSIEQGGSTITQQYVKNNLDLRARTLDRKVKEALWAVELEERLSKEEILERYLNTTYFGEGVYGIGTAARHYFSKRVSELELAESALLAGLIRSPERNNPVDDPAAARVRRDVVLDQMAAHGFIARDEATAAQRRPVRLKVSEDTGTRQPFFVDWVIRILYDAAVDLQPQAQAALGDDEEERRAQVFKGGLVIRTTLDPRLQTLADKTIRAYLDDPLGDPLAAVVTVEPASGAVRAMAVGPKSYGHCPGAERPCALTKVNPAVPGAGGSGRQPGSAFKPFVLAAALEDGFTPGWAAETTSGQVIAGCKGDDGPYRPANYEDGGGGYMNMYEAVRRSNNVYHVKLARAAGVPDVRETARRLGIRHSPNLTAAHFGRKSCSIALGTASVFPLEMASAFGTFANRGLHCGPFAVTRIEDRQGNLIYQHGDECEPVLDKGIADRVTDLLRGPPGSRGTAPYIRDQLGRPVAGKTGTTDDFTNAWFVGYVPQYATAAWVGYEHPECPPGQQVGCGPLLGVDAKGRTYRRVTGGSIPGRIWADYMEAVVDDVSVEDFATPPPPPTATVPDVVGMAQDAAVERLVDKGFNATSTVVDHVLPEETVVRQRPAGGSDAVAGSAVRLFISNGEGEPEAQRATVPNVVGRTRQQAETTLKEAGFDVAVVGRQTDDPSRVGRVIDQDPAPGARAEEGSSVVIVIGREGRARGEGDQGADTSGNDSGEEPTRRRSKRKGGRPSPADRDG